MSQALTTRTLRFHTYGEPADVLRLEQTELPEPAPGRIRVAVAACGLTPADWALCRGLFPGALPRGVGLDVAGVVNAVGEGLTNVAVGDRVLGAADFAGAPVAGASDFAILNHWTRMPASLGFQQAAALPMAVVTACGALGLLGVTAGRSILVHGAGTTVGYAAVQVAQRLGAQVFATAGETFAEPLRAIGAKVTSYGDGMASRVLQLANGRIDLALDTAPVNLNSTVRGALPDLVEIVGGDPRRVMTIVDFAGAAKLGVRTNLDESGVPPYHLLGEFAKYAADGTFSVPIARTFGLDDWRTAMDLSLSGRAHGKLVLMIHT